MAPIRGFDGICFEAQMCNVHPPCRHVRPDDEGGGDDVEGDYYDGQGDVDYVIHDYGVDWIRMRIIIPTILLKVHLSRNPAISNACINSFS